VRPYQAGDEIRNMDWRVTARTGKPHTKLFREERERPALLLVDLRPAMFFATRGALKAVVAAECAALLAWSVVHQGDRVGGMLFDDGADGAMRQVIRPGRGKRPVMRLLGEVVHHPHWQQRRMERGDAQQRLRDALQRALHAARAGSLLIVVSDGRGLDAECALLLRQALKHHQLLFVAIHDPFEAALPDAGMLPLFDGRRVQLLASSDRALREQHQAQFAARQQRLCDLNQLPGFFHIPCATTDVPLTALQRVLGVVR